MNKIRDSRDWWTLLAVCLGTFMLLLDVTIVIVALPDIQRSLGAGISDIQWTIDAYSLSLAALMLAAGSLADSFGRRRLFLLGLLVFTAGSLLCGLAQSSTMLIAARAAQGVGGATMFATSMALLGQTFHGRERGVAFGIWGAVTGLSVALGPVLGGLLTSGLDWRWIFFVNVPVGILAIAITLRNVTESRSARSGGLDLGGFAVFSIGLVSLIYGLIRTSDDGWTGTRVIVCFAVAAALLGAFPLVERRARRPMFELALFRKPAFVGSSFAAVGVNGSLFAMFAFIVLYLQNQQHYSALQAGVRLLLVTGAMLFTAIPAGRLSARLPMRLLIGLGLLLTGAGLLLMRGLDPSSSWTHLIPGFIVAGLGAGMVNPPLTSSAIGVVRPEMAGMASGMNSTFRQIGMATGVAVFGAIIASHGGGGASTHASGFISGLNETLLIAAILALATGALSLMLIRQRDFVAGAVVSDRAPEPMSGPAVTAASPALSGMR